VDLRIGQLVLLVSKDQIKDHWKLGIVDDLEAEGDGRVRQVVVKLKNGGKMRRYSIALVSLEIDDYQIFQSVSYYDAKR
jgi:hypothetical protein